MTVTKIPCPYCGTFAAADKSNSWRPFCSKRCKMIDLGDWLDESNRIPERSLGDTGSGDEWSAGQGGNGDSGVTH